MTAQTPRTVVHCCRKDLGLKRETEKGCLIGGKYMVGMQKKNHESTSFRFLQESGDETGREKGPVSFP